MAGNGEDEDKAAPEIGPTLPLSTRSPTTSTQAADGPPPDAANSLPTDMMVGGRYRIVRQLGRGGMGEVYEAEDVELSMRVALKTLRGAVTTDSHGTARLKREVQLARKVTHKNVCRLFDLGVHRSEGGQELPFLTMELLHGETLAERLSRGPVPPAQALPLVEQMARAIDAAHSAGVVHRDFKSGNVMLVDDRAVVTDFGLAIELRGSDEGHSRASGTIKLVGSPAYMAPEQVESGPVTPATDLYAFGVVIFEMVTGKLPFAEKTAMETATKRLKAPPPRPRELAPQLDARWDKAIMRCLEIAPERRPVSALAAVDLLREAPRKRSSRWRLALALAVVAAVVGAVALATRRSGPWRPELVEIPPVIEEDADFPAISPDGTTIAFISDRSDGLSQKLYLTPIAGGAVRHVDVAGLPLVTARWARDGRSLYASGIEGGRLKMYRVPAEGGPADLVGEDRLFLDDCGPTGLVFQRPTDHQLAAETSAGQRNIVAIPPDRAVFQLRCNRAGDEALLMLGPRHTARATTEMWLLSMSDGSMKRLAAEQEVSKGGVFSADGKSAIYPALVDGHTNLFERSLAGGQPQRLTFDEGPDQVPDVSRDGRTLVFGVNHVATSLYSLSLRGGSPRRLTTGAEEYTAQAATETELFAVLVDTPKRLVSIPVEGGASRRIADADYAALAPGGKELVIALGKTVSVVPTAGGPVRQLGVAPGEVVGLAVGDDVIYVRLAVGETRRVARMPRAGGAIELIAPETLVHVVPSPTGNRLAVIHTGFEGFIVEPGEPIDSRAHPVGKGINFTWAPDGKSLFVAGAQGVSRVGLDGKRASVLDEQVFKVALSPDGQTVYYSRTLGRVWRVRMTNFADRPRVR